MLSNMIGSNSRLNKDLESGRAPPPPSPLSPLPFPLFPIILPPTSSLTSHHLLPATTPFLPSVSHPSFFHNYPSFSNVPPSHPSSMLSYPAPTSHICFHSRFHSLNSILHHPHIPPLRFPPSSHSHICFHSRLPSLFNFFLCTFSQFLIQPLFYYSFHFYNPFIPFLMQSNLFFTQQFSSFLFIHFFIFSICALFLSSLFSDPSYIFSLLYLFL
jgi:hypothetical protein